MAKQSSFTKAMVTPLDFEQEAGASYAQVAILVNAVLVCLVAFGVSLSADQTAAVMGVINAVLALWGGYIHRNNATPNYDSTRFIDPLDEHADHEDPGEFHGEG